MFICEKSTDEIVCDKNNAGTVNEENDTFNVLDDSKKAQKLRTSLSGTNK